jgi:hypothetical protein
MTRSMNFLRGLLLAGMLCPIMTGQSAPDPQPKTSTSQETPEVNYQIFVLLPSYRFVGTSGNPGRVGEYDSLQQSLGGDFTLTWLDYTGHTSLKNDSHIISRDDYDVNTQYRVGKHFSFSMSNRSFIRHLDNVPYGTNLDPPSDASNPLDGTVHTNLIPDGAVYGIKRTKNDVNARLKLPNTPLTMFVKGGWQARRGWSQMQFFDMGGQTNPQVLPPDPSSCGLACHSTSRYQPLNYTTRNIAGGVEMKVSHMVLTYEHEFRSFNNRLQNPVDYYGTSASVDGEPLPSLGPQANAPLVPDALQGFYVHNVVPRHDTQIDMLRLHAPLNQDLTFNANMSYGRTRNLFTNNPQDSFNADATLNWNPAKVKRLHTIVDYHQQNTISPFVPTLYTLFGNPSLHRFWTGVRTEYRLNSMFDLESHYTRTEVSRSNAALWPQFYSLSSVGLVGTLADPFVPRLVPTTFSNTAGFGVKFHHGETWNLHSGYEWIGTHAPGYLTDPQTSHRVFAGGSFTPNQWVSFTEDFSVLRQNDFLAATQLPFPRSNRLYLNTTYVTLKPVQEWNLGFGYAYYQNNLRTDLMFGTDPMYLDPLVPFKAISRSYSISSTYLAKKRLAWTVEFANVKSSSSLRPNLGNAPICDAGPVPLPCADSVIFASQFSMVSVPQALASSILDYRWKSGYDSGLRFQYGSYKDQVHPDLTGHLNSYSLFFGRTW